MTYGIVVDLRSLFAGIPAVGALLQQVDVYSFSMIAYQLFELCPPFAGMDPVDAARKAALAEERPPLMRLATKMPTMIVSQLLPSLLAQVHPSLQHEVFS